MKRCTHIITWEHSCTKPVQAYCIFVVLIIVFPLIQTNTLTFLMNSFLVQLGHILGILIPSVLSVTLSPLNWISWVFHTSSFLCMFIINQIVFIYLCFSLLGEKNHNFSYLLFAHGCRIVMSHSGKECRCDKTLCFFLPRAAATRFPRDLHWDWSFKGEEKIQGEMQRWKNFVSQFRYNN